MSIEALAPRARPALPWPAHLEGLDRYEAGMSIEEVQRRYGLADVVKLASNENPLGPSPLALEAVQAELAGLHRYPDGPGRALRAALAARLEVDPACVVLGNGSTDLIDLLARAYLGPADDAVIADGAFARFRQVVRARNGRARLVPLREGRHDLPALAAAATPGRTRLLFVANPNNPTGTWNTRRELEGLIEELPPGVLLVLDEAYFEYAQAEPDYPCGIGYVRRGDPVVVLRTFSKVYGLAGLRVGYAVAAPEVAAALDTVREPFNTNALGQAAALAALADGAHRERAVELNRRERTRLAAALQARGYAVRPSLGNFLWLDVGGPAAPVFERLLSRGVIVRPLGPYAMPNALRVSVGTPAENDRFLDALA